MFLWLLELLKFWLSLAVNVSCQKPAKDACITACAICLDWPKLGKEKRVAFSPPTLAQD
jgi:hypothetical protein